MKRNSGSKNLKAKLRKTRTPRALACILAAVLSFAVIAPSVGCAKKEVEPHFEIKESTLPTEEKYALSYYDFDGLSDVQTTLRADTMTVTRRNLPRPKTELLSDDFSLVYDTAGKTLSAQYEKVGSTATAKAANIKFVSDCYPYPDGAGGGDGNASKFIDAYSAQAEAMGVTPEQYFLYYKYMLLTQGQHLAVEAQTRSKEGTLTQEWLKKHPAADLQYGAVEGTDNAVEKQITLDTLYRSYHPTGLYLPAGEAVKVKVEGLAEGESISIFVGLQTSLAWAGSVSDGDFDTITGGISEVTAPASNPFFIKADVLTATGNFFNYGSGDYHPFVHSQWKRQNNRAPWVSAEFVFDKDGEYTIGTAFGGIMHINPRNCYSPVKTTITGAVETPHYILGVTTPEYFDEYLRDAPGVYGVLDTENGQLVGEAKYMRTIKTDEIEKLAMLWHSFFSVNESFTGGTYNRPNIVKFDRHVPAGAAVALGNYIYACPSDWFSPAMNYRALLTEGAWGILHEIGHNHATSYGTVWGFGDGKESEVRNNALIVLNYMMFCDTGTTVRSGGGVSHGSAANAYSSLIDYKNIAAAKYSDFSELDYFGMLSMYTNIMHSFGAEKFYELLYTYKDCASYVQENTTGNKRSDFAYRCALVYGMNFLKYFNGAYAAKITGGMFTAEQLEYMNSLPTYEPVACYYAGGIDGVKTCGDYCVAYGSPIVLDLYGKTVSSLDTEQEKGFEIISVEQPEHGTLREVGGGKWEYSFDEDYTGTGDGFSFRVKLSDGIIHKFTVSLRISYNGAKVSTYSGITNPNATGAAMIDNLEQQIKEITPTYDNSTFSGLPSFSGTEWEVRTADFWWKAPESGRAEFAISGSSGLCLYLGENFENLERTYLIYSGGSNYAHSTPLEVEKDKYYAVRVLSCNRGGRGGATVGILQKDGKVVNVTAADGAKFAPIPQTQIFHTDYPLGKTADSYIFEPQFIVSKKDNIKISNSGTDKSEWSIVKAPEDIADGRYYKENMVDEATGEVTELKTDKWTWLIDGQTGTFLHTSWQKGNEPQITSENPHEFILDTSRSQSFNYFSVTTRNNVNSYVRAFELQISDSADSGWRTLAEGEGDGVPYSGNTFTVKFPQTDGRYFRLLVKSTSGGRFSVLSELDAGISSAVQRVIPPTSNKLFATDGWRPSSEIEDMPSGYLVANGKNEKLVIKFRGDGIALYAATGEGFGSAQIRLDGKSVQTVDFDGKAEARSLVFYRENLKDKEHTVEIITKSSSTVMLNVIGIPYTADLINASNIYLERALTISLIVFVALFALALVFILLLVFLPKFRGAVFGNKLMKKLDSRGKKQQQPEEGEQKKSGKPRSASKRSNKK